ncbi:MULTISPECIES: bifunctional 2-polyprenyl-6-hydroxyphenol methylase/3-demethylubiquinol 3-O-methyltransferase UbiG [Thioalkalivibrio]|uniref:class I SAM-dependent methyltransferase n=1 Tax=Thioalkalivibrio TaxID=106633 RepID=UPI00037D875E|nr:MULTISPECIES: class I SAM-dependent methyltransferase [Thioalkalivibrio]OOC49803.1 SAM-dependent methyltransferase [Thioalkalivibrio versutus]
MWDERYAEDDYVYGTEPNDFLRAAVANVPRGRALCLAEGEGRNAVFLAQQGFDVLAVDSSAVGLQKAQRLAEDREVQIETLVADLADYAIEPDSWDLIVSIFCHLPPDVRRRLHAEVVAGLRPGGVFILEAYTPAQLEWGTGGPPTAELMMTREALTEELEGLEFEEAVERERDVIEGRFHTGRGAVVQVLAHKPRNDWG